MSSKYLITGAAGFVAGHLMEAIFKEKGADVHITALDIAEPNFEFITPEARKNVNFIKVDLSDIKIIEKSLKDIRPCCFIHLAALSSVAQSWKEPVESFRNNMSIFLNILEAVRHTSPETRILSVGSSEQYGIVEEKSLPLKEDSILNPISPYAVARVAQEQMSKIYASGYNLDIVMTRSFNHVGPRQSEKFVISGFAKQIAELLKGKRQPVIDVGNLNIVRDFTDVRDVVKAYNLLVEKGRSWQIYNVCSGVGRKLMECLDMLLEAAGVSCEVRVKDELLRPTDNPVIIGDNSKIRDEIGWEPKISFRQTLKDMLSYWMERV